MDGETGPCSRPASKQSRGEAVRTCQGTAHQLTQRTGRKRGLWPLASDHANMTHSRLVKSWRAVVNPKRQYEFFVRNAARCGVRGWPEVIKDKPCCYFISLHSVIIWTLADELTRFLKVLISSDDINEQWLLGNRQAFAMTTNRRHAGCVYIGWAQWGVGAFDSPVDSFVSVMGGISLKIRNIYVWMCPRARLYIYPYEVNKHICICAHTLPVVHICKLSRVWQLWAPVMKSTCVPADETSAKLIFFWLNILSLIYQSASLSATSPSIQACV